MLAAFVWLAMVAIAPPPPMPPLALASLQPVFADTPGMQHAMHALGFDAAVAVLREHRSGVDESMAVAAQTGRSMGPGIADAYCRAITGKPRASAALDRLTADELLVLGVLVATEDSTPAHVRQAQSILDRAKKKLPKSFTVALARAAALPDEGAASRCRIFHAIEAVLRDPTLEMDMRPGALDTILDITWDDRLECPARH